MRTKGIPLLISVTLAAVSLVTVVQTLPPAPLGANAPASEFSAERAIRHIQAMAAQPRPTGTAAYEAAADYVLARLEETGLETETQRGRGLRNTIGWIQGGHSADIVLLTAHLDGAPEGPGATDDAAGVAVLLETARALMAGAPPRNTVMFLFTDAEEAGSLGAQLFVDEYPMARNVRIVVGFDAGGIGGPDGVSATSANNGWLIRQLAGAKNSRLLGSSAISALATTNADYTNVFRGAGFSGYAFGLYWDPCIHTPEDNIANLNPPSIQDEGYQALSLARHFGNLDPLYDPGGPDAIYFSLLRQFVAAYPSTWAIPLAAAVTAIFCGVMAFGLRQKALTWAGTGYGALVLLAGLILAPLPHFLLGTWISGLASQAAERAWRQPLQVGMTVLPALALLMLWYYLSRRIRNVSMTDLAVGALAPLTVAMIGTSIALPAISFTFTWPLLFSLLSAAYWLCLLARRKNPATAIPGLLISGAIGIVVIGPSLLLGLFASAQMQLALVFLGILCGFIVPLLHLAMGGALEEKKGLSASPLQ